MDHSKAEAIDRLESCKLELDGTRGELESLRDRLIGVGKIFDDSAFRNVNRFTSGCHYRVCFLLRSLGAHEEFLTKVYDKLRSMDDLIQRELGRYRPINSPEFLRYLIIRRFRDSEYSGAVIDSGLLYEVFRNVIAPRFEECDDMRNVVTSLDEYTAKSKLYKRVFEGDIREAIDDCSRFFKNIDVEAYNEFFDTLELIREPISELSTNLWHAKDHVKQCDDLLSSHDDAIDALRKAIDYAEYEVISFDPNDPCIITAIELTDEWLSVAKRSLTDGRTYLLAIKDYADKAAKVLGDPRKEHLAEGMVEFENKIGEESYDRIEDLTRTLRNDVKSDLRGGFGGCDNTQEFIRDIAKDVQTFINAKTEHLGTKVKLGDLAQNAIVGPIHNYRLYTVRWLDSDLTYELRRLVEDGDVPYYEIGAEYFGAYEDLTPPLVDDEILNHASEVMSEFHTELEHIRKQLDD